ncbi:MAG TPA: hypothetical protein VLE95_04805 [Chlamydiales bacterium]|nr:hypothetical protein [Chlamydiales bacterium]
MSVAPISSGDAVAYQLMVSKEDDASPSNLSLCERVSAVAETRFNEVDTCVFRYRKYLRIFAGIVGLTLTAALFYSVAVLYATDITALIGTSVSPLPPLTPELIITPLILFVLLKGLFDLSEKWVKWTDEKIEFQESPDESSPSNKKKVVLLVRSENDYNGAFTSFPKITIKNIENQDYEVVKKTISKFSDIARSIEVLSNQDRMIQALWICAHGTTKGFFIDNDNKHSFARKSELSKKRFAQVLNLLPPDCQIVLHSCNTGSVDPKDGGCVAQTIANFSQRVVTAPNGPAYRDHTICSPSSLTWQFIDGWGNDVTCIFTPKASNSTEILEKR